MIFGKPEDTLVHIFKRLRTACLGLVFFLLCSCTHLFYQPNRVEYSSPKVIKDFTVEEFFIQSLDQTKLRVWSAVGLNHSNRFKGVVAHFHGNSQNVSSHIGIVMWLANEGFEVLSFDYRGYGKSEKFAEPDGVRKDATAFLAFAQERAKEKKLPLFVYGQSLGAAIALRAIEDTIDISSIKAVVVEGGFASYQRVGKTALSKTFLYPLAWVSHVLVSDRDAPKHFLHKRKNIPLLVIHSQKDPVVKFKNGAHIYAQATPPKCLWEMPEVGHVNMMFVENKKYREGLVRFLKTQTCP